MSDYICVKSCLLDVIIITFVIVLSISARPCGDGMPTYSTLSRRPGLITAGSIISVTMKNTPYQMYVYNKNVIVVQ